MKFIWIGKFSDVAPKANEMVTVNYLDQLEVLVKNLVSL